MKIFHTIALAPVILCCLLLTGCWINISPADPSGEPGPPVLISSRASYLTVPVVVQLKDVQSLVNTQVPTHVEGTHHITVTIPHCAVHWHGFHTTVTCTHDPVEVAHIDWHADRGQIQLTGSSDKISVHSSFAGGGKLIPSAATADASGTADGSSTLTVGPDYNLTPSVDLNVNIESAAVLHDISVKGLVQGAINDQINKSKATIGAAIGNVVDLRKHAQSAWSAILGSVVIPETSDIWITINPQAVMLEGPHATGDTVTAVLALKADVKTLFQPDKPEAPARVPLPNIAGGPADGKFHISLPIEVQMEELNHEFALLIRNKTISEINVDDYSALLKSITVLPYGNRFYLKVGFVGEKGTWLKHVRGTLIFVAHPILSPDKQTLSFDQIDYTPETLGSLKGFGEAAVATLLKPIFTQVLQKKLVINFGPSLEKAKSKANDVANNKLAAQMKLPPPLSIKLNLDDLKTDDLAVYGNKIYLGFDASGSAEVRF